MRKSTIETRPVAWANDVITKYQSSVSCPVGDDRTLRILGDPKPTEEAAMSSLMSEFATWKVAIVSMNEAFVEKGREVAANG